MSRPNLIRALIQQATVEGSRSTALKPLGWLVGMLLPTTLASFYWVLPKWISVALSITTGTAIALYLFCFVFLLFKDPDALRSERYSLQKLAIEKGLYGDSITGLMDAQSLEGHKVLAEGTPNREGDRQ